MSWLRTAVNRAVDAGGNSAFTRTLKTYADSAVSNAGSAVFEGARIIQDRIAKRTPKTFKQTVKSLEALSVTCKGVDRANLLIQWVANLKEPAADSIIGDGDQDLKETPKTPVESHLVDKEHGTITFREVFLHSQALEGIILSMILEAPNEEEVGLLSEIFGLCLEGPKENHNAIVSSVQDLAGAFSCYEDEVLIKKEELLHYAQEAIARLKIKSECLRIDAEATKLMGSCSSQIPETETSDLKENLKRLQQISSLEELLTRKRSLLPGDSLEAHSQKLDKLRVLSESLQNSASKAETRLVEHRSQKEEALAFRAAKSNEVSLHEMEMMGELEELEKKKLDLELQLAKINSSINAVGAKLQHTKEERESLLEANNQIIIHLKTKEDEISRSITSCKNEVQVVTKWVHFLEDMRTFQSACAEQTNAQINEELKKYGHDIGDLVVHVLSAYKDDLSASLGSLKGLVNDLDSCDGSIPVIRDEGPDALQRRRILEEQYMGLESKILEALSIVDIVRIQFLKEHKGVYREDDERMKQLFEMTEKMKREFESTKRQISKESEREEKATLHRDMQATQDKIELELSMESGRSSAELADWHLGDLPNQA